MHIPEVDESELVVFPKSDIVVASQTLFLRSRRAFWMLSSSWAIWSSTLMPGSSSKSPPSEKAAGIL
jgi:hypothetical protein